MSGAATLAVRYYGRRSTSQHTDLQFHRFTTSAVAFGGWAPSSVLIG